MLGHPVKFADTELNRCCFFLATERRHLCFQCASPQQRDHLSTLFRHFCASLTLVKTAALWFSLGSDDFVDEMGLSIDGLTSLTALSHFCWLDRETCRMWLSCCATIQSCEFFSLH